jgi:hypothetical protein
MGEPGVRAAGEKKGRHSISSPLVKYKYNCHYLLMTFRKRLRKKKFSKNDLHTLQGTLFHRLLTNTSRLKITAAYCWVISLVANVNFFLSHQKDVNKFNYKRSPDLI